MSNRRKLHKYSVKSEDECRKDAEQLEKQAEEQQSSRFYYLASIEWTGANEPEKADECYEKYMNLITWRTEKDFPEEKDE